MHTSFKSDMSDSSNQENHQSDGIYPPRVGSLKVTSANQSTFFYHQQPSTNEQDTLYGNNHNERPILENKGTTAFLKLEL